MIPFVWKWILFSCFLSFGNGARKDFMVKKNCTAGGIDK